jgi:hypothetical protein
MPGQGAQPVADGTKFPRYGSPGVAERSGNSIDLGI